MTIPDAVHAAWLPPEALRAIGSRHTLVLGEGRLVGTVHDEVVRACARYGGRVRRAGAGPYDLVLALTAAQPLPEAAAEVLPAAAIGDEGYVIARRDGVTVVLADEPAGLLYGLFHVVRLGEEAFAGERPAEHHRPATRRRMLDHWDNVDVHPVMGQVERGYAGGSLFWRDGAPRGDLARV
ncbi:alpha-glucuronidase family glycosyl hydrolase, partial [Microbispora sp. NPDC049633]|uniref:alpha-glucuronidase family glycosyl hydrolase n=1 Tax=Microbispora sp. NPDC049633 TaxID=3154355 RepID=UPI00342F221D